MSEGKRWWIGWLLPIIAVIVLAVSNPSQDKHKETIHRAIENQALQSLQSLGAMAGLGIVEAAGLFKYQNYFVCSVLKIEGEVLTIGILGRVFINEL